MLHYYIIMDSTLILTSALRTQGHKITKNRTAILEFLSNQSEPIAADEVLKHIQEEHQSINKTTVYRELFFLLEHNFIHEVELGDGKKRYEIALNRPHHHHIVCINCKKITDIPLEKELESIELDIEKTTGYELSSHMLEFFGLCKSCK